MSEYKTKIHVLRGDEFELHPLKAMFWKDKSTLILSDIHIGKAAHFRKNGIAIHTNANKNNFWNLSVLIEEYTPERLLILGDLSHSHSNSEWDAFVDFRMMFTQMTWVLVDGNHDMNTEGDYQEAIISTIPELQESQFRFVHDNSQGIYGSYELYSLSGHIHPAVRIKGAGRQSIKLDCFYFGLNEGILPAFGEFTGRHCIKPRKGDALFGIAESSVVEIPISKLSR
jgi:uncharacterized protein